MTRERQATHTIQSAAGRACHFARITVAIVEGDSQPPIDEAWLEQVPQEWLLAANSGIAHAKSILNSIQPVLVMRLDGANSDTREDTVFAAAAMATFKLFGDESHEPCFQDGRWYVKAVSD